MVPFILNKALVESAAEFGCMRCGASREPNSIGMENEGQGPDAIPSEWRSHRMERPS